jgi:hypothetical protein
LIDTTTYSISEFSTWSDPVAYFKTVRSIYEEREKVYTEYNANIYYIYRSKIGPYKSQLKDYYKRGTPPPSNIKASFDAECAKVAPLLATLKTLMENYFPIFFKNNTLNVASIAYGPDGLGYISETITDAPSMPLKINMAYTDVVFDIFGADPTGPEAVAMAAASKAYDDDIASPAGAARLEQVRAEATAFTNAAAAFYGTPTAYEMALVAALRDTPGGTPQGGRRKGTRKGKKGKKGKKGRKVTRKGRKGKATRKGHKGRKAIKGSRRH